MRRKPWRKYFPIKDCLFIPETNILKKETSMKITIKIDTASLMIIPSSDADNAALARWLLEEMPGVLGTYYGRLAAKLQPGNALLAANNSARFTEKALEAFSEG